MRIAVIGTGISGMLAAYLLHEDHDLTVYEANDYVGGHTHTHDVPADGNTYAVDTGFIVFNEANYPTFVRLLRRLGVAWKPSRMGFSVRCERTGLEYRPSSLDTLFAQRRNLVRPWFWRMVRDIFRFRRQSVAVLETGDDRTLGQYLADGAYSRGFIDYFIVPMGSAIWSSDPVRFREFPVRTFVQFFENHGFLRVRGQPEWQVVRGGSKTYVEALTAPYRDRIRLRTPVRSVRRMDDAVEVRAEATEPEQFDHVVIAAHSNQALAMLADPTPAERDILGAIPYQENETVLHTDTSLLPRRRKVWASWNYHVPAQPLGRVAVTYAMNILQGLDAPVEFCVTLNRSDAVDPDTVIAAMTYAHPVFEPAGVAAQQRHAEISGVNRTHYCGAYWGYGFHEDGAASALAVARCFGKTL
jgi:predicted NAD/FAD-binding protein